MFPLRCAVRRCPELLQARDGGLTCPAGHHFDRAKEGYFSLLQPQDRKSSQPGDCDDAVLARHRWLRRGHASGLIQTLRPWVTATEATADGPTRTLDLGCGEGSFGPAFFGDQPEAYCGIDLSKRAIKLAARGWSAATWVWANADRVLPAADASVDRVVSWFGRRPVAEIDRVLTPAGACLVAVPAEDDLIELRESVQQTGQRRSRWESIADEFAGSGLRLHQQQTWRTRIDLDRDEINDAMAMTYRGARRSQHAAMESIDAMTVTLSADLLWLGR